MKFLDALLQNFQIMWELLCKLLFRSSISPITFRYIGDGRFHLESIMIQNPSIPAFQYNPYSRKLTKENYGFELMVQNRANAINTAKKSGCFGLVQGTIGRQGNPRIFDDLEEKLKIKNKVFLRVLLSEIFANKLALFTDVEW